MTAESIPAFTDDMVEHRFADLDDVRLHYVEAGEGPTVVLLHGFPEFWYSWRHQIGPLVAAGFRVVAPDLRGYGRSDKPRPTSAYRVEALAGDVAQLVAALGVDDVDLVGHDWGGMVAWWTTILHAPRVRRLSIANCPHPAHHGAMLLDPAQVRRSWYMLYFQLPWLAVRGFEADDFARLEHLLTSDPEREGAFTAADIARYKDAFRDGATIAAMRYYRALLRRSPATYARMLQPIERPTQVIWGARDRHLGLDYAKPPAKWVWDLRLDLVDDASHWVQVDRPTAYNAHLLDFLATSGRGLS